MGHPLCWIQFNTKDIAATTKFFHDVFGWKSEPFANMPGYYVFVTPKGLMGGFQGDAPADWPHTIPFLYVADIDAALAQITASGGGMLVGKTGIPEMEAGHIAIFTDPAGCTLGLSDIAMDNDYTPLPFGGAELPLADTICSMELYGGDFEATQHFYEDIFAWGAKPMGGNYMAFSPGSGVSGVFQKHTPQAPALAYLWTDDIAAAVAKVQAAGGVLSGGIIDAGDMGHFAYFTEPGGIWIGLIGK
jgi:uncharacterized protein